MSPPYARFEKLEEAKQEAILMAAREEFVRHGYEAASLNQVITEAGISKGSFYYYFEDKLDLFITVLERVADPTALMTRSGMLESEEPEEFWSGLEKVIEASLEITRAQPDLPRLSQAFASLSPQVMASERVASFVASMSVHMVALVEHGQAIGAMREDIPMSVLIELWMGMNRTLDRWGLACMERGDEEELRHVWQVSAGLFRRMCAKEVEFII